MFKTKQPLVEPKSLLFYGIPKVGKTTIVSKLPNSIIIDFEDGTDYINHDKVVPIKNIDDLFAFGNWYKNQTDKATFLIADSLTAIENMLAVLVKDEYNLKCIQSGKPENQIKNYMELAYGLGTSMLRDKYVSLIKWLQGLSDRLILIGHVKKKDVSTENLYSILNDLDLTGKLASIIPSQVDTIGYFYREGNKMTMSFVSNNDLIRGSRVSNLANKEIESSDYKELWKQIYPETLKEY